MYVPIKTVIGHRKFLAISCKLTTNNSKKKGLKQYLEKV